MLLLLVPLSGCVPPDARIDCAHRPAAGTEPPEGLSGFELLEVDPDRSEMQDLHLLLTSTDDANGSSFSATIDGCGHLEFWAAPASPEIRIMRTHLGRDGESVLFGTRHRNTNVDEGRIQRVDLEGDPVSSTRAVDHHHDFVELPEGGFLYFSRERVPDTWLGTGANVAADALRIAPDGSRNEAEHELVWSALSDIGAEPEQLCGHTRESGGFIPGHIDWTHANSLARDDASGEITMGVRHFDAVLRMHEDGTPKWWLGGPLGTLTPLNGAAPPRHGHFSEAWSDGLVVFDNGNHVPDAITRVVEYRVDEDAGTYEEVFSFEHPTGRFFNSRGDVRRTPGGNYVIAWTGNGQVWEVTPEGDVVWGVKTQHKVVRMEILGAWPP